MARQKGESNQGIVVSLVFFILSTIALGVTTYLGYTGQEGKDQLVKDADAKTKAMTGDRDWYKWQAMAYRMALGRLNLKDPQVFSTTQTRYASGELERNAADKEEIADVKDLLTNLDRLFKKPDGTKDKGGSYEGWVAQLQKELKDVTDKHKELTVTVEQLNKTIADKDVALADQKKQFDMTIAKLNTENMTTKTTQDTNRQDLEKKVKDLTEQNAAILTASAEEKKKLLQDLKKANDTLASQKSMLTAINDELLVLKSKASQTGPKNLRTDWKIATIQGNNPYINLGSADNVKAQLTFTIHGLGPDGRANPTPKGMLEVVNVIGPHLSQARITDVKDPARDPVLVNDVINNSAWDPFQKRRIALAGYMDLYGDGRDGMAELRRILERQNVIVDSYLDPKDFSIQGAINLQTEYLVLGDTPESLPYSVRERDGFGKKLGQGIDDMQAAARRNGVPVIGLRKFLDSIGYKLPRPLPTGR